MNQLELVKILSEIIKIIIIVIVNNVPLCNKKVTLDTLMHTLLKNDYLNV